MELVIGNRARYASALARSLTDQGPGSPSNGSRRHSQEEERWRVRSESFMNVLVGGGGHARKPSSMSTVRIFMSLNSKK